MGELRELAGRRGARCPRGAGGGGSWVGAQGRRAPTSPRARPQAHLEERHWQELQRSRERRLRALLLSSARGHGRRLEAA